MLRVYRDYILGSLTTIEEISFWYCTSLVNVTVNWPTPLTIDSAVFYNLTLADVQLNVPHGTADLYKAAAVWKEFMVNETLSTTAHNPMAAIQVYPNPVTNQLHVTLNPQYKLKHLNIYNSLGYLVKQVSTLQSDVSTLSTGLYILEVVTHKETFVQKIVVE